MPITELLPARYRGAQPIGKGGMGEIFRATDTTLGRAVAIKLLAERYADDDDVRGRFTREALAAARLSGDPHIVTIYDVGEHRNRPYIVMEYMGGGSLEDRLRGGKPCAPRQVLDWLDEAAAALDHAHAEGVVHRDVKPGNLLLDRDEHVHVADFGIASAAGMDSLTMTGTVMGTAGYLSPEQAQGERATPASDLYGLAVVAFELLTGSRPFEGDSITAEASAHINAPVPSASARNRELPPEVDDIFRKALAKDPRRRYDSAASFAGALRDALRRAEGPTRIVEPTPPTRAAAAPVPARRPSRRRTVWPFVLAAIAAAAIAGIVAAALLTRSDSPQPEARTIVRTITGEQRTIRETVTQPAPAPTTEGDAESAPAPPAAAADGHTLNDQGYAKVQAGDYEGALPLLQGAVQKLQGTGPADPYEGYANYNLGYTLYRLGRCDEAITYLSRAEQLEPDRHEPRQVRKKAEKC